MPNPLTEFDGQRKYVFSRNNENFYLRICTSYEELQKCRPAAEMDCFVSYGARLETQRGLEKKGEVLQEEFKPKPPSVQHVEKFYREILPTYFTAENNRTFLVLENAQGKPACVMSVTIDDPKAREALKITKTPQQERLIYVDDIIAHEDYRGQGLMSLMFNEAIDLLPSSETQTNRYVISMRSVKANKKSDGQETGYVINLPAYYKMWSEKFAAQSVVGQMRSCYGSGPGIGAEELLVLPQCPSDEEAKCLADGVEKSSAKTLGERKFTGAGMFLHGVSDVESQQELLAAKSENLRKKQAAYDSSHDLGWQEAPQWQAPQTWRPCAEYATFQHPVTGKTFPVPLSIQDSSGQVLQWKTPKLAGWSVGGWYESEFGEEFLAKMIVATNPAVIVNPAGVYTEKLLNDLMTICADTELGAEEALIGHGLDTITSPCFMVKRIKNYRDLINIKADGATATENDHVALRKVHATKFHPFYAASALIGNDDLNEENLGLRRISDQEEIAQVIDLGIFPPMLLPEQASVAHIPYQLASFIGHRNLRGIQLVRRRYFGHDDFLNPQDRLKPQLQALKPEDISYLSVLDGINNIIKHRDQIIERVNKNMADVQADKNLTEEQKENYVQEYAKFADILTQRIDWMRQNFADDLMLLKDEKECERFDKVKWRLHPKFAELMTFERENISLPFARNDLQKSFAQLGKSREEILSQIADDSDKLELKKWANENLILHNAIIVGDVELVKALVQHDISDINKVRPVMRKHNHHLFRTTPLHAAIATYHDALFYQKNEELEPLREMIEILERKFIEKNGEKFDDKRDYKAESADAFAINMTFNALQKYHEIASQEALAATKIQRAFRAHQARRLSDEAQQKGGAAVAN